MTTIPQVTRLSLKNILFPTDFSAASSAALPFALALARTFGSTLLVAHAIPPEPRLPVASGRLPAEEDRAWQDASHKLDEFTHDRSLSDLPSKVLLARGDLSEVILRAIREHQVDLVVLGTHGRRGVAKLVMGSEAEKIYRSAPCPVLTVGPRVHEVEGWKLRRILCPFDAAEDPGPVLHYGLSLAEENQSDLIVLEAIPLVPWQHRASMEERSRRALESLMPAEARNWCSPEYVIRWEYPAEAILSTAQEREVDLIVMSVHNRHASLSAHLPWPIASEVVNRAPCPVLTVRV